jgi:hypothetical protein
VRLILLRSPTAFATTIVREALVVVRLVSAHATIRREAANTGTCVHKIIDIAVVMCRDGRSASLSRDAV